MKRGWELAKAYEAQAVAWRRHLHSHPELSFEEFETASFVAEHLESMGYSVRRNVGGTGVMGTLETGRPGPVVAFRADIDALQCWSRPACPLPRCVAG